MDDTEPVWVVVNSRDEAISKALYKRQAADFLYSMTGSRGCRVVHRDQALAEQRMVREITFEQAQASGVLPPCFAPRDGVRFELHTILPVEL